MKATPLLIAWHDDNAPIYSVHFDPHGKGRLATAGNDNNVRLWKVESTGEERKVTYLSTLIKHTQAVNVVRFCPKGEMLASAGDDGNVLLWVPSETQTQPAFGQEALDDKETWRVKHMCRSSGAEIYDLAWSPDGVFIITGSMDNIARIYNAQTGQMVRQIAEHSHYVQGVAWDPLNEYVATQSSDRSVHIYALKTKDGQFTLTTHGKFLKMDLPAKRVASSSPVPDFGGNRVQSTSGNPMTVSSPGASTPGTPLTAPLPMDPPPVSLSRRSSFGSSPSIRRSASPAPSVPLPAVKPLEAASPGLFGGIGVKNASIYANETFNSFFRRLTFAPDGSLLFTPAGQYKVSLAGHNDKVVEDIINTVYVYTRAGFNKPPIAHLPGHKKPHQAHSPDIFGLIFREEAFPLSRTLLFPTAMEPPSKHPIPPVFALPYRMVYAVATQDAVLVYDTQQQTPLCVVNNLHFATFTDLSWSHDGLTLIMSSSDGFCSSLSFSPGELGQVYTMEKPHPISSNVGVSSNAPTVQSPILTSPRKNSAGKASLAAIGTRAPTPTAVPARAASSGPATPSSATSKAANVVNNPTPILGTVPSVTATNSSQPFNTPPETPMSSDSATNSISGSVLGKRDISTVSESEKEDSHDKDEDDQTGNNAAAQREPKRKRIAPTLVSSASSGMPNSEDSSKSSS
ncbi:chromatin assembly factor 1 subunit B [Trichophyton equinum CBS 127.97]|uniref:Chromatin assembly factor 1 subunit B n=1 Tax=Trichophyton equinum (strain ATCC MYA-4606 / CBS 127.97) TaxID=559882 RepID=F2PY94_TRIEC|nr:chromatin assembly factor 1 subunit B [Trichophyton equinum CBS 127.97]